jgi:hypothetical protein
MVPGDKLGTFVLVNGIALPILNMFDGTGSTAMWLEDFFHAAEKQYKMLDGARTRYNTQLASSVVQDVCDSSPVVQISQFESDERSAEQVRLLQPDSGGGDAPEDYDLGLVMGLFLYADIWTFYGLKGYFTLTADEIGRGLVTKRDVKSLLGQSLDQLQMGDRVSTADICHQLLDKWHFFLLQVPSGGGRILPHTTNWWSDVVDPSRVLKVSDPRLLAEVRAGLVYVTEALNPSPEGLVEFLRNDADQQQFQMNAHDLDTVWRILETAEQHFSAQAKLPEYQDIPRPGDIFAHYRHAWPIGHPRESENVIPPESNETMSQ